MYNAEFTDDLRQAVEYIHTKYIYAELHATAFSLGSNVLLRMIGQDMDRTLLSSAVCLFCPFDLVITSKVLHASFISTLLYSKSLTNKLKS